MKKKILSNANKPSSREDTCPKTANNTNFKLNNYLHSAKQKETNKNSFVIKMNNTCDTNFDLRLDNTLKDQSEKTEAVEEVKTYENLITKMFTYLKDKVPQEVYEEMKEVLHDEYNKTAKENSHRLIAGEGINIVAGNSRNNKKPIIDEKILDSILSGENKRSAKNSNHVTTSGGITNSNTNAHSNSNSIIKNYQNSKNLKLSFDFSKPLATSPTNTFAIKSTSNKDKIINKLKTSPQEGVESSSTKDSVNQTGQLNLIKTNYQVPHHNINLKGYLNNSNNIKNTNINSRQIIKKSNEEISLGGNVSVTTQKLTQNKENIISVSPSTNLFNVIKVGSNITHTKFNHPIANKSKTQFNSKSNSRDSRSFVNSISQSKSKTKSGAVSKMNLTNNIKQVNGALTYNNPNNAIIQPHLKLNTNLLRKTGFSPDNIRNPVITNYAADKAKGVNKKVNLSTSTSINFDPNAKKGVQVQVKLGKQVIANLNKTSSTQVQVNSSFNLKAFTKNKPKENSKNNTHILNNQTTLQNTCYSGTGRDTYISNNTVSSMNPNDSKKVISAKKIMDLTYNVSYNKNNDSARVSNKELSIKSPNLRNQEVYDIGVINSEASVNSKGKDFNENSKNGVNLEMLKEIKLNLDDNLKNMFNFSYECFHKERSESGYSTKKSEDLSEHDLHLRTENDFDTGEDMLLHGDDLQNLNMLRNSKKLQKFDNFHNQISFDENEEKLKDKLFMKKESIPSSSIYLQLQK